MAVIEHPLGGLIQGMIEGHQLARQLQQEADAHQAFLTQQALHNQEMSFNDIQRTMDLMSRGARPVVNGMVQDQFTGTPVSRGTVPQAADYPTSLQNLPAQQERVNPLAGMSYLRKPGGDGRFTVSLTDSQGNKRQYEMPSPEEQLQHQIQSMGQLAGAEALAKAQAAQQVRTAMGGEPPADVLAEYPGLRGYKMLPDELPGFEEKVAALRQARTKPVVVGKGGALVTPTGQPMFQGAEDLTGENQAFKDFFAPGYYKSMGITNPQPSDVKAAYDAFRQQKAESSMSEAELAMRAARGDTTAQEALRRLDASKLASRPVNVFNTNVPGLAPGPGGAPPNPQLTGDAFLKTLPPATAAQIRGIAEGRSAMPSASTRSQGAMQLRQGVFQYDPSFSDQRAQIRKAFTTGPDGRNIGNLNTASVHLDQLAEAANALGNGQFRMGNSAWNALRKEFGSGMPTTFEAVKAAAAGEMANALKGQATDPEIKSIKDNIMVQDSPRAFAAFVRANLHVLGAKLNTYQERYRQQNPTDTVYNPVLPSAAAVYDKYGIQPTAPAGGAAGGGAATGPPLINTKAQYDALPSGAIYTESDGKTYRKP